MPFEDGLAAGAECCAPLLVVMALVGKSAKLTRLPVQLIIVEGEGAQRELRRAHRQRSVRTDSFRELQRSSFDMARRMQRKDRAQVMRNRRTDLSCRQEQT